MFSTHLYVYIYIYIHTHTYTWENTYFLKQETNISSDKICPRMDTIKLQEMSLNIKLIQLIYLVAVTSDRLLV